MQTVRESSRERKQIGKHRGRDIKRKQFMVLDKKKSVGSTAKHCESGGFTRRWQGAQLTGCCRRHNWRLAAARHTHLVGAAATNAARILAKLRCEGANVCKPAG